MSCTSDAKLSDEYCHLVTEPVLSLNVSPVLLVPVHTIEPPEILPPTDVALMVKSVPLFPPKSGKSLTTLILYPVPSTVLLGMVIVID